MTNTHRRVPLLRIRCLAAAVAAAWWVTSVPVHGQDLAHYRDFHFGSTLASVSATAGLAATDATVVHERPVLMQNLRWRRPYTSSSMAADPVQQILFHFVDDQLFRLVVEYDPDRTQGLTDADLVAAISREYGTPSKALAKIPASDLVGIEESGTRLAHWGDADYSAILYRSSYAAGFRLVVASARLESMARAAEARAVRQDDVEAPAREVARRKKQADDAHAAEEQAREKNKAAFRP